MVAATKETCADGGTDGFAAIYTTEGEGNQHNLKFVDSVTMTYALAGNYTCDVEITGVGSKSYPAELTVVGKALLSFPVWATHFHFCWFYQNTIDFLLGYRFYYPVVCHIGLSR